MFNNNESLPQQSIVDLGLLSAFHLLMSGSYLVPVTAILTFITRIFIVAFAKESLKSLMILGQHCKFVEFTQEYNSEYLHTNIVLDQPDN